jgi:hypothetical protein
LSASGSSSTAPEQRQRHLEQRAEEAAANRAAIDRARLRRQERESVTEYGSVLLRAHGERVALALEHTIGLAITRQVVAGPYHAGMWLLFHMEEGAPLDRCRGAHRGAGPDQPARVASLDGQRHRQGDRDRDQNAAG